MDKSIEEIIIAVLENTATLQERKRLDDQRQNNAEVEALYQSYTEMYTDFEDQDLEQPSARLQQRFEQTLEKEKTASQQKTTRFSFMQIAAAASILLLVGLGIGSLLNNNQITEMNVEIAALRSNINVLLEDNSTSARIQAVNLSYELESADPEILDVLIRTMNNDPSEHVQLSAIDALGNFIQTDKVKSALIETLENKRSPYVQIKIIKILSGVKAKEALPAIDKILNSDDVQRGVLKEATAARKHITNV